MADQKTTPEKPAAKVPEPTPAKLTPPGEPKQPVGENPWSDAHAVDHGPTHK